MDSLSNTFNTNHLYMNFGPKSNTSPSFTKTGRSNTTWTLLHHYNLSKVGQNLGVQWISIHVAHGCIKGLSIMTMVYNIYIWSRYLFSWQRRYIKSILCLWKIGHVVNLHQRLTYMGDYRKLGRDQARYNHSTSSYSSNLWMAHLKTSLVIIACRNKN